MPLALCQSFRLYSGIPPLNSEWRLCGNFVRLSENLWYPSNMIITGKAHEELMCLWNAVSVAESALKFSVRCSGCKSQLQETELCWLKNFMLLRNAQTYFIHLSGLAETTYSWSRRDQSFSGLAQHYLLSWSWLNRGNRIFHEGFCKQVHFLCQNCISSVGLLRLDDYLPWSQHSIFYVWVHIAETVILINVDILVLLGKYVVVFWFLGILFRSEIFHQGGFIPSVSQVSVIIKKSWFFFRFLPLLRHLLKKSPC